MRNASEESFKVELQNTFLGECYELIEELERECLHLEQSQQQGAAINRIFRYVHTIKGSAYAAGFEQLGRFTHVFEMLIDALRTSKLQVPAEVIDDLLAGKDCLHRFATTLQDDREASIDTAATEQRITASLNRIQGKRTVPPIPASGESVADLGHSAPDKLKILVCEDDEDARDVMVALLSQNPKYEVLQTNDGAKALALVEKSKIDVILTDYRMPHMNGVEFVEKVRKFNRQMPVVFVSGYASDLALEQMLHTGALAFVQKPFTDEELIGCIDKAVNEFHLRQSVIHLMSHAFKAYVSFSRVESILQLDSASPDLKREAEHLKVCIGEMQSIMKQIVINEDAVL